MGIRSMIAAVLVLYFLPAGRVAGDLETITFPSADGLLVTADVYIQNTDKQTPFIVLFHQASWSRGEYLETAPRLNTLGFNCMAIDQRSGSSINSVTNETNQRASAGGLGTSFVDAIPDMLAAIAYARANYADNKVIGMGSSYSSALILKLAGDDASLVDGVASFSPGEYFGNLGQPSNWIQSSAMNLVGPVFITSRMNEQANWQAIFDAIPSTEKVSFLPATSGQHGSRALWSQFSDSESYWDALASFLEQWIPSLTTYRRDHGLAADGSEDLQSSTADGVSNLMKYALGFASSDSLVGSDLPRIVEIDGERFFILKRFKNRTDIAYEVEVSASLGQPAWNQIWSSETNPYLGGSASCEEVLVPISSGSDPLFARLRVIAE